MASAAVSVVPEREICKDIRIVLGGIATHPYRSREAEALLNLTGIPVELTVI